ncbi:hypothetical protein MVEN_02375700 [Mycena venus]|uniref:Uncharacterized protein n=1 Tax=Mycena venus TaxID=2733690 RepID=A0A8H6X2L3_9AGAR|nr:hypothetical protein MVEN_02375700 [Mycena venus]
MPRGTKQRNAIFHARQFRHGISASSDNENEPPSDDQTPVHPPSRKRKTLAAQISEKDERITELETTIADLESSLRQLQYDFDSLQEEHSALVTKNEATSLAHKSLSILKRKADATFSDELRKKQKRIRRLENDRETKAESFSTEITALEDTLDERSRLLAGLEHELAASRTDIHSRDIIILSLQSELKQKQSILTTTRQTVYALRKKSDRAKCALKESRKAHQKLQIWRPTKNGQYTAAACALSRDLTHAGCSAGKIAFAVQSCARAFGIKIHCGFMSARTVGRVVDEGGKYGEIQLAREIMNAPGFVESSDGTTLRGITVESRHITLLVPSYAPNVDDSNQSTWQHRTRFVEVAPALDHTAQRQFQGTMEAANRIADVYSRSPLAAQERRVMEKNEYWRKKLGEGKDHAADGKKEFKISAAHKKDVIIEDLGRAAMDDEDTATGHILTTMMEITDEDLAAAGKISMDEVAALSIEARSQLSETALERRLGEEKFESLTPEEQANLCTHVFGGCCCHKDLNVLRIGYHAVQLVYSTHCLPPPVLLANKANAATIDIGSKDLDNAAVQAAVESSTCGAIKLLQLIGAVLRHKDSERGYQDKCTIFMRQRKLELYDLDEPNKFPDVFNNRYGCYSYAAAEVVCFHGLIQELVTEIIDGKTNSGQANHMEQNILKGLNCDVTMTELVALALYGASVSWPYMATVRGTKDEPINLLSLTGIHRKLPEFCAHVAAHPYILLDPTTSLETLTIDGKPFLN